MIAIAVGSDIQVVTQKLIDTLGSNMTARVGGCSHRWSAHRWAKGLRLPDSLARVRLKLAHEVVGIVSVEGQPHIPRAFMNTSNPNLADLRPIDVLCRPSFDDYRGWLLGAARHFAQDASHEAD